ncbi:MAG: hypothetical protein IJ028_02125, partial [Alistipes sp.]|nr:hypothetical protein [Alistipes sp.]
MQRFLTKSLFAVVLSLLSMSLYAQGEKVTVSGVVTSAEDKLPLIGVAVVTEAMSGVTTSIDGDYTIEVEA